MHDCERKLFNRLLDNGLRVTGSNGRLCFRSTGIYHGLYDALTESYESQSIMGRYGSVTLM